MQAVKKMPIIDQVVNNIKQSIIDGKFVVDQKLPSELSLCKILGVSRSTVREAFRILQAEGFVEVKSGRGSFVKNCDPTDFDAIRLWFQSSAPKLKDFFEVRCAIEGLACRKAALRSSPDQIGDLEKTFDSFVKAVETGNVAERARLDELFHTIIVEMAQNSLLTKIHGLIAMEFKKYRSVSFAVDFNARNAIEPHYKILEALKQKDGIMAEKEMIAHLDRAIVDMDQMVKV